MHPYALFLNIHGGKMHPYKQVSRNPTGDIYALKNYLDKTFLKFKLSRKSKFAFMKSNG